MDIRQQLQALLQPSPELDLSQGYRQGLFAQGQGITPQQARQRDLTNAIQRNQQRIQTEIDGRDRALAGASDLLGYDIREQSNNNVRALTPEQRLQSFIAGSNHDPELAHDIQNMDDGYLRAKYGNAVADYAYNQRKQSMKDLQLASSYIPENQRTGSIGSGLVGGVGRGLRQMGGIVEQLGIMAFNDGEEQANKLRESQQSMNEDIEAIAKWQGSQYSHQHAKGQIYTQLADRLRQTKYEQIAAQTGNPELAKVEADKVAEQYHSHLNTITEELMVNGLGEQAPQILLAVMSGGVGAGVAEATALGISRVVATQAITKALPKIAQAGAMIGVGVEAGLQDGTSAATDAYVGVYDYYDQAFKESQQGDSTKWNELFGSKEMQALAQQYPEASPDELIRLAANNASTQAGLESGLFTGVSAGIAAPTLSGFSAKLAQGFKPSQRAALSLTAPVVEGGTEYLEERKNIVAPREAINKALGVNVYDNPELYAHDQALQAGAIGAFAGSASSISGIGSAIGSVGKKALSKGKEYLDNKANEVTQKENQTKSEETEKVVAPLVNDINVYGTSGNEEQEAVDGVLDGKNMSNSSFGEKYRELVYAKAKSEGKEVEAKDYGSTIYDLDNLALNNYKEYMKATKEGNVEKANEYGNKVNEWVATKKELSSAMWEDINSVSTDFKTLYEENSALNQEYAKLQSDLNKGNISEEQYNTEKAKLDTRADDIDARLTNLGKIGDQFQALAESTLFTVLNSPVGEVASQGTKLNKLPLKEHLKKLGKTDRTIRSFDDVLYHSTSTIKLIEQATSSEEATEYINSWLDGVRNFTSKDMNSAEETFKSVQTELKKIKDYLDTTPYKLDNNSYLGSIIDNILSVKNVNEGKAKTYLEKFFIGKNSIIGLTRNNDMAQLLYFQNSQQRKIEAVMNAYRNAIAKELVINDANPITDIVTGIGKKGNPLYLTKSDGSGKVSFSSYGQMKSYLNSLKEDYDLFTDVISKIVQNNLSMDNTLVTQNQTTTPETTQDKVDTQTQPKETKSSVTGSKETKSATTEPVQKKDDTKTQTKSETQSESNTEQSGATSKKKSEPEQKRKEPSLPAPPPVIDVNKPAEEQKVSLSTFDMAQDETKGKDASQTKTEPENKEKVNKYESEYKFNYKGKPVNVWAGSRQNAVLSNLTPFEFTYLGFDFESVEHAYQTLKNGKGLTEENKKWAEANRETFKEGKTIKRPVKVDTNSNLDLMYELLTIRSQEDNDFIEALSNTGLREITHKNPNSSKEDIWTNVFPEMLMRLRDEILAENNEPTREDIITDQDTNSGETQEQSTNSSEPVQEESIAVPETKTETKVTPKEKPVKEKSLVEPMIDGTGSTVGYTNTNSGKTYRTEEEALNDEEILSEKAKPAKATNAVVSKPKVTQPKLHQDPKTHINTQVKESFEQMQNSDNLTEEDIATFGLKDKVLDNGLTQKTVDRLYAQGYDLNRNLVEDSTETVSNPIDVDTVLEALNQDYENLSDEQEVELVTKFIKAYNPNLSETEVNEFLASENADEIATMMLTFKGVLDKVNELLDGDNLQLNPVTITGEQYNDSSHFAVLKRFNAFTNVLEFDEQGNLVYSNGLRFALAKTLMEGISSNLLNGRGNHKAQTEFFRQMSDETPSVYETTLQEESYTVLTTNKSVNSVSDISYWDNPKSVNLVFKGSEKNKDTEVKPLSKRQNFSAQYDYGNLGRPMFSLLEDFGTDLLSNLNLKFKKDTPSNLVQNITQALGGEVLGILKANNMLATYKVEFPSKSSNSNEEENTDGNVKLFYGTLIVNSDITKAIPQSVMRAFKARLSQMNGNNVAASVKQDMSVLARLDQSGKTHSFTNGWLELALDIANVHKTDAFKLLQGNTQRTENFVVLGSRQNLPETFGSRTNTDPILTSTPKEIQEAVKNHDKIAYEINLDNLHLFENNRQAWRLLGGWVNPSEIQKHIPAIQESLTTKNNSISRVESVIEEYVARARSLKEDISKVKFHFSHTVTQTQRIQFDQPISVQNDKLLREMFVAKAKQFTEVNTELASQNKSMDWAITDLETMIAPVETSITVPNHNGVRDIEFLTSKVEDLAKKVAKNPNGKNTVKQYEHLSALMFGVAQAVGLKIERLRESNVLTKLKEEFKSNAWLESLTDTLWELHNNPTKELTEEEVEYFKLARDKYGSSAPRLYSALNAYAQFKHLPNKSKLSTNFYLEADGIGNGMSNLVRQFPRGFTPTYFNTLKRVGITTFDMIVKYMNAKEWNFDNLSKEDLNNLGNMLEGSANHFDPESNENSEHLDGAILDIYETVAEYVQESLEKGLNYLLNENDEVNLNNEVIKNTLYKALNLHPDESLEEVTLADLLAVSENINKEIFNDNSFVDKYNLLFNKDVEYNGVGNEEFVAFWTAIKSLGALSVLDKNVKIGGSTLANIANMTLLEVANNLGNLKVEIKRNLAKLGVTPAMYGGGVGGISNQITSDILGALQEKLDEIYVELVENKTVNETLLKQVIVAGLALNIPMINRILDENPRPEDIIHLSETVRNNKTVANRALKSSVGKLLYEGVQDRYGEFLKNGNAAIASETAIMNKLAFDLKAHYEVAQEERNKAAWKAYAEDSTKGWSETDPRNNDALSKTEERKILTALPSLPLFATAFSNNEVLVDNLLREGHTISKKRDITNKTGTNTAYALTNFEYAHKSLPYSNTFAFKVVNRLRSYTSGGATIFTNSVVSTESKVQAVVNTVLKKVGKATLNVFDGLDANSLWRKVVGQVANKAYNEIHLNTNLQESIFHRVNRSNLSSSLVSLNLNGNSLLLKGLNSTNSDKHRRSIFEAFGEKSGKGKVTDINNVKLEVNAKELQFLDTLASIVGTLEIGEWSEAATGLRTAFNDATTKLLASGSDTVVLDMNPTVYLKFMEGFINFKPVEDKNLDYVTKSHILYNMMLETLADKAATVYAMKEIERTLLAFNVNQFGGANRGYFHNAETFFTNKELVQSFRDFLNANPNLNGTDALVKFIETNEFIQSKMSQYKAKKLKELKPAYKDTVILNNSSGSNNSFFSSITNVGEALDYLESLPDDNSIQANTRKALLSFMRVEGLSELDKPVYTTVDNFEKYVKPNSPIADVKAGVHNSKLIYVSENAIQREEILLHELVHSISTAAFKDYFMNNGANLKAETKEAIKQIELNALKFAELFKHHPRVAEVLNHVAENQVEAKYYKQEIFGNSNTRIESVAAALLLAKNTNSSDLRYTALVEFLAYGLTKDSLTNAIYYQRKAIKQKESNADKSLLKVLKSLKKFIDQIKAQIRKMFFGSYEGIKVDDSMLFDILANLRVVAYDNSKVRKPFRELNENFYNDTDTTGSNSTHESYLNRLRGMIDNSGIVEQLNQVDYLREKNIFDLQEVHNLDNAVKGIIPKLRQEGISFTQQEVSMFNTMSALNAVIFDTNPSLRTEAERWVNKVLEAKIDNFPLNTLLQGSKFDLATVMALAMTNEQIKSTLSKVGNTSGKASLIENTFNDLTVYLQASKSIKGFKNQNTLTKLAYAIASSNLDKALTEQRREEIYNEELKRYEEGLKFVRNVENISGSIPKPFAKLVVGVTSDWANSRGLLSDSSDEESTIGKLLTYYAEKHSEMKGMPTWVTQALRLVLQARTKTQYIYAMRSKFVGAIEQARETVRQVIPEVIYNYFEDNYTKEIDNIIGTSVLPINLVNVFNDNKMVDMNVLQRIIQDRTSVQREIKDTVLKLREVVNSNYENNANEIVNILTWQAEGLGSMMLNRSAKSVAGDVSHFILPNPNAIASLYYYKNGNFKMSKQQVNHNMDLFRDLVGKLATLHSLVQLDKKDFQDLQMLVKEQRDGLQAVLEAQASVNDLSTSEQNYDFIGTEGFVHYQQDPNISLQIVMKNSPDMQRLQALGYTEEAYLSDTNWVVMKSLINPVSRYQTGSFGSTEVTYKGTSIASLEPLHSVTADVVFDEMMRHSYQQAFYKTVEKASKIPDYYKTLKAESNIKPVMSPAGYIATFSIELPTNLKKQLVTLTDTGTEALGNMMGRIMEENRVQEVNAENIRILNQKYRQARDKRNYVNITGYAEVSGSKAQQEFAKRLNDFYWALPYHTRQQIDNEGGLWVYRNELDNVIGYRHLDITDLWTGKSTLPKPVQDLIKSVFKIFQFTGSKPANTAKVSQDVVKEIVSAGKDVVLNKSLVVGAGNIISNVIHLLNVGVPHDTLATDLREGLINAQNYVRNNKRLTELEYKLAYSSLTHNERRKMEAEVKFINDSLKNNPVMPLVEGGILSTIAGVSGYEHQFDTSKDFTYRKKLLDKVGISDTLDKLSNSKLGKALENALVLEGSSTHDFMVRALDYGDFVAKYALYKHLTRNRDFSEERAMNVIREEFVNYTMNRGRYFDYANALGLTWFASYALGIQKVIYRALRRNTLSTLAIYGGGKVINDYDRLGLIGTVPNQNLFERSWDYTTSTSNVLDSFEAHWMARLLPQLF